MIARTIPDAWSFSNPERVLAARHQSTDAALRRMLADQIGTHAVAEAAQLARDAAEGCEAAGRPLFGAHLALL